MAGGHGDVSSRVKWEVWWYESYSDEQWAVVLCSVQWCETFGDMGGMVMWEVLWCERYGHVRGTAKWCEQYGHVSSMVMWAVWWCERYSHERGTVKWCEQFSLQPVGFHIKLFRLDSSFLFLKNNWPLSCQPQLRLPSPASCLIMVSESNCLHNETLPQHNDLIM